MRDPYLYDDVNVLKNLADIKDTELLRKAEADITGLSMAAIYDYKYDKFNAETLQDIHRNIFCQIFDWAGEFRTIQMVKYEDVLGGDTVRYAYPKEIKKQLNETMKEIAKLKRTSDNDKDIVFKLVRIIASIWQIHPFREGNGRITRIWLDHMLKKNLKQCIDWSQVNKKDYLAAMTRSVADSTEIKRLLENALKDKIDDRETFMKGIDYSYYYEQEE